MKRFFVSILSLFLIVNFACTKKSTSSTQDWSGTLTTSNDNTTTTKETICESGNVETRIMYEYGASNCVSEKQTRTCKDSTWENWSGNFTAYSCPATNQSIISHFFFN
ncbi:MAG: hypothetical protein NTY22_07595 [Proteobacteria bacterium]|nr:hypothetical protein [Pseudomonadota bacterium]